MHLIVGWLIAMLIIITWLFSIKYDYKTDDTNYKIKKYNKAS